MSLYKFFFFYNKNNPTKLIPKNTYTKEILKQNCVFVPLESNINPLEIYNYLYKNTNENFSEIYIIQKSVGIQVCSILLPIKYNLKFIITESKEIIYNIMTGYDYTLEICHNFKINKTRSQYIIIYTINTKYTCFNTYVKVINIEKEQDIHKIIYRVNYINYCKQNYIIINKNKIYIKNIHNNNKFIRINIEDFTIKEIIDLILKSPDNLDIIQKYIEK